MTAYYLQIWPEYYEVKTRSLLDTGNDVTIVRMEYLGIDVFSSIEIVDSAMYAVY